MIGLFAWYVYALLALMLVGAGVGSIIRGNTLAGGGYVVGGLLLFGIAVISGRRNKTVRSNVFETNMTTLLPALKALILKGKNTDAIRRYRVLTGSDLNEAKIFIDRLAAEQAESMAGMDHHLKRLIGMERMIEAIKHYKSVTGADYKEAKDYVEAVAQRVLEDKND